MRRFQSGLSSLVLSFLLALALMLPTQALAQEEPLPEGVNLEFLAFATVTEVPDDADQLVLFRMLLAPRAVFPITPAQGGVALAEVESGVLTTTVDGPTRIARAGMEPGVEEEIAAGETFTLEAGDSALYPPGLTGDIRNEGPEEVSLLVLEAVPPAPPMADEPAATPVATAESGMTLPEGATVTLLAAGEIPDLPAGAFFAISRVGYEPGVGVGGERQPGAEVAVVESGTFTLAATEGPPITVYRGLGAALAAGAEPTVEMLGPGETTEVTAGDGVAFPAGNVTAIRNDGAETAVALLGLVVPADAAME